MTDAIAPPKCHNKSKGRTLSDEEAKVEQINDAFLADIEANNVSNIKKALDEGQNPNVGTESGESSVHLAMRAPTTDILKALIAKDAHLEFQDDYDKRPIEIGIEGGANQVEHIKVLLKQKVIKDGVEVLAVDLRKRNAKKGTNLLHTAAWVGNLEATKVLLETAEFDDMLEDTNIQGQTALHLAAFRAPTELCQKLVERGANPAAKEKNARRISKETPEEMALSMGRDDTSAYLRTLTTGLNAVTFAARMKHKARSGQATGT